MGRRLRAVVLCACLAAAVPTSAEVIDRVLAVAAGEVIMLSDVVAARELGFVAATGQDPTREALTALIDRALILAEVERYAPPEPGADALEAELRALRLRFADQDAYEAALARTGRTETHLRETIRQNLRIRAYLEQRFTAAGPAPQQSLVDEWVAGLRRRADIVDLYRPAPRN
jgi:parvulin-like peptidyl-prolyl isomerase